VRQYSQSTFATAANAIQALIDDDAIAFTQIAHRTSDFLDDAGDLVSEICGCKASGIGWPYSFVL
jgi:hypothetical protein